MANKLSLNVAKTEFQIIGTKQMLKKASVQQLKIHIQNIPIKQVFQCKTLGVTVDENLCWKSNKLYVKRYHLEYTLSKALKNMLIKKHSFPYTML